MNTKTNFNITPYRSAFEESFDKLFEDFFTSKPTLHKFFNVAKDKSNYPKCDVHLLENGNLMFEAAVPGMKKEDINVELDNNILVISGKTQKARSANEENYFIKELKRSSFSRKFEIQEPINTNENVHAELKNGILYVIIPMEKNKKIPFSNKKSINIE